MGFVKVNVDIEDGKPVVSYVHDETANVGTREQTIGMGEGQIPIEEWKEAKAQGITKQELINRRKLSPMTEIKTEEVDFEDEPVNAITNSVVRPKRPKNQKDWWDDPRYNNEVAYSGRYYRGVRLIPPNIGGNL